MFKGYIEETMIVAACDNVMERLDDGISQESITIKGEGSIKSRE